MSSQTVLVANLNPSIYQGYPPAGPGSLVPLVIMPGLNEIESGRFAEVFSVGRPAQRVEDGDIVEVKKTSALDVPTALNVAKLTGDLAILRKWHAAERRPKVAAAVDAQIQEIEDHERKARR